MLNSKSSKQLSNLFKEIVNPLKPTEEERVHGRVAELPSSHGQFTSMSAIRLPSFPIPKIITSLYTDPKNAQGQQNTIPRKPSPHTYSTLEFTPTNRDESSPERHSSNRLHKSTSSNSPRPLPYSRSPKWSPEASPAMGPTRIKNGSQSSSPNRTDLGVSHALPPVSSSRPNSYHSEAGSSDGGKANQRHNWLQKVRSRSASQDPTQSYGPKAWVLGTPQLTEYNLQPLIRREKVPELWNEHGDFYVYLSPPGSRPTPSFKLPSRLISSSPMLMSMAFGDIHLGHRRARSFDKRSSLSAEDAFRSMRLSGQYTPPYTPRDSPVDFQTPSDGSGESINLLGSALSRVGHLYFPLPEVDASQTREQAMSIQEDHLIAARNFFAFLTTQPLVATRRNSTSFAIFNSIAHQLKSFRFGNFDGSTFGEEVSQAFDFYIDDLYLGDVRNSEEKNIEAIVLGEGMRSTKLFNESYVHAVARCAVLENHYPRAFSMISEITRHRLEQATFDLEKYQESVLLRLSDCEFPGLFVGTASSSTSDESKLVRFKGWKNHFGNFRRHFLSYYRDLYGSWPPKGSSKKNFFQGPGLKNRLVLQKIYNDLCSLYDLLVNRELLTTRSMDMDEVASEGDPAVAALRKVLTEYDRSSPPVQPPMPFDVPIVPNIGTIAPNHHNYSPKVRQKDETRKLKEYETILVLTKSHNMGSVVASPFLDEYFELERKEALGKSARELEDQRIGYWLFVYVVLQALPMLVVDAPDLRYDAGVEYFLCIPPSGIGPWIDESRASRRAWYGVTGSSGVVSLPSDVVNHGVQGTYARSHCWIVAEQWLQELHAYEPRPPDHPALVLERDLVIDETAGALSEYEDEPRTSSRGLERPDHGRQGSGSSTASNPQFRHQSHERPRSRSISKHRSSAAFGLQQLPVPYGYEIPTGSRQSSRSASATGSPRFEADYAMRATDSDMGMGPSYQLHEEGDEASQRNFDEILTGLEKGKERESRWSRW